MLTAAEKMVRRLIFSESDRYGDIRNNAITSNLHYDDMTWKHIRQ